MQEHTCTHLNIILDLNSKFLSQLKQGLAIILQGIRVSFGLQMAMDFHNQFNLYCIDSNEMFVIYESQQNELWNYDYHKQFEKIQQRLYNVIEEKDGDDTWESKFVRCFSSILCKINKVKIDIQNKVKQNKIENRLLFITSKSFQFSQGQYHQYLSICNYAQKSKVRIDLIEIDLGQNIENNQTHYLGNEGFKLGVQLTKGIAYELPIDKLQVKLFSQILLSSFNPGESQGFLQPNLNKLIYRSFCFCCNKVCGDQAFACSNCLTILCEKQKGIMLECPKCKCTYS